VSLISSSDRELQPGDVFGPYEILALAGKGGMGVVYRAFHVRLERNDALKLLRADLSSDPGFAERFRREAKLVASIHHRNVVVVYDWGVEDDRLFLAMEWIDGADLRSILDRDVRLPTARAVAIVLQTAAALEAVHTKMVHRDVKPANIMVTEVDEAVHAYLTDFGIARPTSGGAPLTQLGMALGTPGYASPEQAMGYEVDRRADLYALGCVFFEAISGKSVCSADDDEASERARTNSTPPSLVPVLGSQYEPFDRFLAKALAIDRNNRYSSASEFTSALQAAASEYAQTIDATVISEPELLSGTWTPDSRSTRAESHEGYGGRPGGPGVKGQAYHPKRSRKRIALTMLTFVVLIGVAVGIVTTILPGPHPKPHPSPPPWPGPWGSPVNLQSSPLGSAPTAGVDGGGGEYVFWEGTNGRLWARWRLKGRWYGPGPIFAAGRSLASQPAVAVHADGQQDVFWKRSDGSLWEISHTTKWQKPMKLNPGPLGSAPTAGVDGGGGEYVFWEGPNGTLWEQWQFNGQWSAPAQVIAAGDGLASQPAVAVHADGQQDVFWKSANGTLWEISHNNAAWQKPKRLRSGPMGSAPTAGVAADNSVYVFWEGETDNMWGMRQFDGRWSAPRRITGAGDGLESQPAVAVHAVGQQDVFWKGIGANLWETSHRNGNSL
jgi:serine/threonine protein kinase